MPQRWHGDTIIMVDALAEYQVRWPTVPIVFRETRSWARQAGFEVPDRGRLRPEIWEAWNRAH